MFCPPPSENIENLDNYLAQVKSAKSQIIDLNKKIEILKNQEQEIVNGNQSLLQEYSEKAKSNLISSEDTLKKAKIYEQEINEKDSALSTRINTHLDEVEKFGNNKAEFLKEANSKKSSLLALETNINESHAELDKKNQHLIDLENDFKSRISVYEDDVKKHQEELSRFAIEKQAHNISVSQHSSDLEALDKQRTVIQESFDKYNKQREEDFEINSKLAKQVSDDKANNEQILKEINEKSSNLTDLIIKNKKAAFDADQKAELLRAQEIRTSGFVSQLEELKQQLSKQEAS